MHRCSVTVALPRIVTTTEFQFLFCSFPFLQQYRIHSISAHSRPYRHVINLPTRVIRTVTWTINNYHYLRPWLILAVVNRSTIQQLPPALVFKLYFFISWMRIIIIIYCMQYNTRWIFRSMRSPDIWCLQLCHYKNKTLTFVLIFFGIIAMTPILRIVHADKAEKIDCSRLW